MKKSTLKAVRDHALTAYPREACGLIVKIKGKEKYRPCKNLAKGDDNFVMDPQDYTDAENAGEITMVVHSHPEASCRPSEADRVMCEETGLPWMILSIYRDLITGEMNTEDFGIIMPEGYEAPLEGRQWQPPTLDCYSLIRDYYSRTLGINLPDFETTLRAQDWWDDATNSSLYLQHFEKAGFVRVDGDPKEHDVIIMEIASKAGPNHAGVYLGDDTGYFLHHLYGRPSSKEIYGGFWLRNTSLTVRHKDLI